MTGDDTTKRLVVVVEDVAAVRLAVSYYLESAGYMVHAVELGEEAVQYACEKRVDLLVTDVMLNGMSGAEIASMMRRLQPDLPVLYVSAHPRSTLLSAGRVPPDAFTLQKPFTGEQLISCLDSVLRRQRVSERSPLITALSSRWRLN